MKYSVNPKLNYVLNAIEESILANEDAMNEIVRYEEEFWYEPDYNYAQYGNLLVYHSDIRELYESAGYTSIGRMSDDALWRTYLRQVGYVIRELIARVPF